jgi:probable phosphoglycerate mutase
MHPNELVVAVLHGGVIGHIIAEATGSAPFAFNGCDNGSISRIVIVDGKIAVRGFNDVSHLGNAEALASLPT